MAKKKKIALNRTQDLELIDSELDEALERLAASNEKVNETLSQYEPQNEPVDEEPSPTENLQENARDQSQSEDVTR